jgi:DNA-binding NarL/FixJ family response regulator
MQNVARVRVALVEDSALVRAGVRAVLDGDSSLEIVGEAGTAADGRALVESARPHVVILDWRLPDSAGDSLCRELRGILPDGGILVLTSSGDAATVRAALEAGADGYLLKDTDGSTLREAIRAVAEGRTLFDRSLTEVLASLYGARGHAPGDERRRACLTEGEERLLGLLAEGLTNKEIGVRLGIAEKTVKNQLTLLFPKVGARTRVQAATWWLRHGA